MLSIFIFSLMFCYSAPSLTVSSLIFRLLLIPRILHKTLRLSRLTGAHRESREKGGKTQRGGYLNNGSARFLRLIFIIILNN